MSTNFTTLGNLLFIIFVIILCVKLLIRSGEFDSFKDILYGLLTFDKMITPILIIVVYWLSAILIFINGLVIMFGDDRYLWGIIRLTDNRFGVGLLSILWGIITLRVSYEIIITLFKINDNLKFLRDTKENEIK